ncbi:hypothetical protein JCM19240_2737 [Vibrio maritimus]|uniref:Uncharacterized protein n=1 Tax=Vibrio maritimus TaxID=990268 RepID=A0A090TBL2_9VIBR|nr:hypothetical protein JCM19240_2737 [Vibrio maritimus]
MADNNENNPLNDAVEQVETGNDGTEQQQAQQNQQNTIATTIATGQMLPMPQTMRTKQCKTIPAVLVRQVKVMIPVVHNLLRL